MAVNPSGGEHGTEDAARIARLYRLASTEEPSRDLDAVIAAAARRSAASLPERRPAPWWNRWRLPFAFAAVAVISVSLVTLMMEEGGERLTSVPPAERDRPASAGPAVTDESQAPPPARVAEPPPPSAGAAAVDSKTDAGRAERARREVARAQEAQRSVAEPRAPALQQAPSEEAAPGKVAGFAAPAQDRALVPAAPAPRLEAQTAASEGRAAPAARVVPHAAPSARAPEAERSSAAAPRASPEVAAHVAQLEGHAPSLWVERILALRKEGRRADADGLLAEFKRRFPDETLPPSLR